MANATFLIGGEMVDVFGPRAEQLAHRLAIAEWRGAADLADRIGLTWPTASGRRPSSSSTSTSSERS